MRPTRAEPLVRLAVLYPQRDILFIEKSYMIARGMIY